MPFVLARATGAKQEYPDASIGRAVGSDVKYVRTRRQQASLNHERFWDHGQALPGRHNPTP